MMTSISLSSYEIDLSNQADALERAAAHPLNPTLATLDLSKYDRIILTGMGSSDSVSIPFEYALLRQGMPVWRIQTSGLLDTPEIMVGRTLLWVTSQSGRSGEAIALLSQIPSRQEVTVVAMTNDTDSPLARSADHIVPLYSGAEASVSCKSYLNSLACFHRLVALFSGASDEVAVSDILKTAQSLRSSNASPPIEIEALSNRALAAPVPRLALIGTGVDSATALAGALILKEASKVCAEGYAGGAFRHGPIELAGPGLTALMFGDGTGSDVTMRQLASDLSRTGSIVVTVTAKSYEGAEHIAISARSAFDRMAHGMSVIQRLSVSLAKAVGIVPGEFRFGQKITSQL
ncbi:MAG: SIS domain-containing protein [Steroidobacteraceae bacterium]